MKKLIFDEMNIKDLMYPVDLNEALYTTGTESLSLGNSVGNVIMVEYNGQSQLDLMNLEDLDFYNNEYIVLSLGEQGEDNKRYIYLKKIPMK